jgi:hypothetical protein
MNWATHAISTNMSGSQVPLASDLKSSGSNSVVLGFATGECGSEDEQLGGVSTQNTRTSQLTLNSVSVCKNQLISVSSKHASLMINNTSWRVVMMCARKATTQKLFTDMVATAIFFALLCSSLLFWLQTCKAQQRALCGLHKQCTRGALRRS